MKKLFTFAVAALVMLATACAKDDVSPAQGGEQLVSFSVSTPELATRAISDGKTATDLTVTVYEKDANGSYVQLEQLTKTATFNDLQAKVDFRLVTGKTYCFAFWAQAPDATAYTFDEASATVNIDYANCVANDEAHDAFFASRHDLCVDGAISETITLNRPFAQLNVGTTQEDWANALKSEIEVTKTNIVVVENVYTSLNLLDGEVSNPITAELVLAENAIPNESLTVSGVDYKWLSMNYLLVNEKELTQVRMLTDDTDVEEKSWANVPLQRNYRTNILGNILTSQVDFNIVIDPIYDGDINDDLENTTVATVATVAELQAAIDAAVAGDNVIKFEQDIDANSTRAAADIVVTQKEGINILIDGCGYKFDGTFYVHGQARHDKPETLTFNKINFAHADGAIDFISCNTTESAKRYAHNVFVTNCTFTGNDNGDVVGLRMRQCYNITISNSKFEKMHSLMWATGGNNFSVNNVEVVDCKNGISFGTTTGLNVANSTIEAAAYGIRVDGGVDLTVNNCNITAKQPVIVRKMTSGNAVVNFEGENTLNAAEKYQVIITGGSDDEAYSVPAGTYTLTGAEDFCVYPDAAEATTFVANSVEQLNYLMGQADVKEILLASGVEFGTIALKSNKIINGELGGKVDCVNLNGADNVTLKNIDFDAANALRAYDGKGNAKHYANIFSGGVNKNNKGSENLTIEGCNFTGTFANGGDAIAFTDQGRTSGQSGNITIKGCTFTAEGGYYHIYAHYSGKGYMKIENNTFSSAVLGGPIYLGRYQSSTPVEVKGNKFEAVATFEDAAYIQAHSASYTVSFDAADNTFAN